MVMWPPSYGSFGCRPSPLRSHLAAQASSGGEGGVPTPVGKDSNSAGQVAVVRVRGHRHAPQRRDLIASLLKATAAANASRLSNSSRSSNESRKVHDENSEKTIQIRRLKDRGAAPAVVASAIGRLRDGGHLESLRDYTSAISAAGRAQLWATAGGLLQEARRRGCSPDEFAYNAAVGALVKGQQWPHVLSTLDEMPWRELSIDAKAREAPVHATAKAKEWRAAMCLVDDILDSEVDADVKTYSTALRSLAAGQATGCTDWAVGMMEALQKKKAAVDVVMYNTAIDVCSEDSERGWEAALKLQRGLRLSALRPSGVTYGSVMRSLGRAGLWYEALASLGAACDSGGGLSTVLCNTAIGCCQRDSRWQIAMTLQEWMSRHGVASDEITLGTLLSTAEGDAQRVEQLFKLLRSQKVEPNAVCYATAASGLAGDWARCLALVVESSATLDFSQAASWATGAAAAGRACERAGLWQHTLQVLQHAQEALGHASSREQRGQQSQRLKQREWKSSRRQRSDARAGGTPEAPSLTPLAGAALVACVRARQLSEAKVLGQELREREAADDRVRVTLDSQAYEAAIAAAGAEWQFAGGLLEEMRRLAVQAEQIYPEYGSGVAVGASSTSSPTSAALSGPFLRAGRWQEVLALLRRQWRSGMQQAMSVGDAFSAAACAAAKAQDWHLAADLLDQGRQAGYRAALPVVTGNSVLSALSQPSAAAWDAAAQFLEDQRRCRLQCSTISFSTLASASDRASVWQRALPLAAALEEAAMTADVTAVNAALSACARGNAWGGALQLLTERLGRSSTSADVVSFVAIMTACERAGEWSEALGLYSTLGSAGQPRAAAAFNAVSRACVSAQQWETVLESFLDVTSRRLEMDAVSCNTVINACEKGEAWELAVELMHAMREARIIPDQITYNTVISACGKSHQWQRALLLVHELPSVRLSADAITWSVVVNACQRAQQTDLAMNLLGGGGWQRDGNDDVIACSNAVAVCEAGGRWELALQLLSEADKVAGDLLQRM
eukprot:TRINITY_DN59152_c0_g1_i1.p1 TRINITY_DN59152_c0_g1~~TRINITY_DN59152_c0_g1_i1.p1  ORF type:complete len:1017 (+),score=235.70 TRINITY_DN59152_c0_g1_i1:94-3144(+)